MPADRDDAPGGAAECLRGRLCRERVDAGSKSERLAVRLVVADHGWRLTDLALH